MVAWQFAIERAKYTTNCHLVWEWQNWFKFRWNQGSFNSLHLRWQHKHILFVQKVTLGEFCDKLILRAKLANHRIICICKFKCENGSTFYMFVSYVMTYFNSNPSILTTKSFKDPSMPAVHLKINCNRHPFAMSSI